MVCNYSPTMRRFNRGDAAREGPLGALPRAPRHRNRRDFWTNRGPGLPLVRNRPHLWHRAGEGLDRVGIVRLWRGAGLGPGQLPVRNRRDFWTNRGPGLPLVRNRPHLWHRAGEGLDRAGEVLDRTGGAWLWRGDKVMPRLPLVRNRPHLWHGSGVGCSGGRRCRLGVDYPLPRQCRSGMRGWPRQRSGAGLWQVPIGTDM